MSLWPLSRLWPQNGTTQVCWQCLTSHLSCTCSTEQQPLLEPWPRPTCPLAAHWTGTLGSFLSHVNFTPRSVMYCGCCPRTFERGIWVLYLSIDHLHGSMCIITLLIYLIFPPNFSSFRGIPIFTSMSLTADFLFILVLEIRSPLPSDIFFYMYGKDLLLKYHSFRSLQVMLLKTWVQPLELDVFWGL